MADKPSAWPWFLGAGAVAIGGGYLFLRRRDLADLLHWHTPSDDLGGEAAEPAVAGPAVWRTRPHAIFVSVDLPAPFGPSRPTISPSPTSRSTPARARFDPYVFSSERAAKADAMRAV